VTAKSPAAAGLTTAWRNRIIGSGQEAPDQLLANPANWRIHPKAQQDALAGAQTRSEARADQAVSTAMNASAR
jgi:hypothetical protein